MRRFRTLSLDKLGTASLSNGSRLTRANPERRPKGRSRSPKVRVIHAPLMNDPG
jgi:hypothetical protein